MTELLSYKETETPTPALIGAPPVPRTLRISRAEALVFLYAPFVVCVALVFATTADDPFITLRVAANVVHGYGPVFNRGQHVQGITSPLHLLIAIAAYALPWGHALFKLKLASLLFGLLTVHEAGRILYGLPSLSRGLRRAGCVVVATGWTLAFASSNALSTALEAWLLVWLVRTLVVGGRPSSRAGISLLAAAAVLTRPDALLVVCAVALAGVFVDWHGTRRLPLAVGFGGLLCAGCDALASWLYYRDPLPNTFYAKEMELGPALHNGWQYLLSALQPGMGVGAGYFTPLPSSLGEGVSKILFVVQVGFLIGGVGYVALRFRRGLYLVAVVVAQAGFVLASGGDWMIGGRFFAPTFVEVACLEMLGLYALIDFLHRRGPPATVAILTFAGGLPLIAASVFPLSFIHDPAWALTGIDNRSIVAAGDYQPITEVWLALPRIAACVPPGATVATTEVGYFGFVRQNLRLVDMRGLTNRPIAKGAPPAVKSTVGVQTPDWTSPTSVVGKTILQSKATLIIEFDSHPTGFILGGAYRNLATRDLPYAKTGLAERAIPVSVYVRSGRHSSC